MRYHFVLLLCLSFVFVGPAHAVEECGDDTSADAPGADIVALNIAWPQKVEDIDSVGLALIYSFMQDKLQTSLREAYPNSVLCRVTESLLPAVRAPNISDSTHLLKALADTAKDVDGFTAIQRLKQKKIRYLALATVQSQMKMTFHKYIVIDLDKLDTRASDNLRRDQDENPQDFFDRSTKVLAEAVAKVRSPTTAHAVVPIALTCLQNLAGQTGAQSSKGPTGSDYAQFLPIQLSIRIPADSGFDGKKFRLMNMSSDGYCNADEARTRMNNMYPGSKWFVWRGSIIAPESKYTLSFTFMYERKGPVIHQIEPLEIKDNMQQTVETVAPQLVKRWSKYLKEVISPVWPELAPASD